MLKKYLVFKMHNGRYGVFNSYAFTLQSTWKRRSEAVTVCNDLNKHVDYTQRIGTLKPVLVKEGDSLCLREA